MKRKNGPKENPEITRLAKELGIERARAGRFGLKRLNEMLRTRNARKHCPPVPFLNLRCEWCEKLFCFMPRDTKEAEEGRRACSRRCAGSMRNASQTPRPKQPSAAVLMVERMVELASKRRLA
jgi:hypothetical protein